MGRIRQMIRVDGRDAWTLFDSGTRNTLARIWMTRSLVSCLTILVFSFVGAGAAWAEVTPDEVRDAIAAGVRYLKSQQLKDRGSWPDRVGYPGGVTALCTLALLESGEPLDSPAMNKAMSYLRQLGDPQAVYVTALQTMVFCTAEPKKDMLLIQRNAEWLAQAQIMEGERAGGLDLFFGGRPTRQGR